MFFAIVSRVSPAAEPPSASFDVIVIVGAVVLTAGIFLNQRLASETRKAARRMLEAAARRAANARLTRRFHAVEEGLRARGIPFGTATLAQMDGLWQEAKAAEASLPPPVSAARAVVARIELTAPEPARAHTFWTTVAPALGWTVEVDGGEWSVETPGLCFSYAAGPAPAVFLTVDAPGLRTDAASRIREAGGTVQGERPLVFRDPVGTCVLVRV